MGVSKLAINAQHNIRVFFSYITVLVIVVILAFIYIWEYTQVTELHYKLERSNRQLTELKAHNRELRMQVMTADSLSKVEKEATKLGLGIPDRGQVVFLEDPPIINKNGTEP